MTTGRTMTTGRPTTIATRARCRWRGLTTTRAVASDTSGGARLTSAAIARATGMTVLNRGFVTGFLLGLTDHFNLGPTSRSVKAARLAGAA